MKKHNSQTPNRTATMLLTKTMKNDDGSDESQETLWEYSQQKQTEQLVFLWGFLLLTVTACVPLFLEVCYQRLEMTFMKAAQSGSLWNLLLFYRVTELQSKSDNN